MKKKSPDFEIKPSQFEFWFLFIAGVIFIYPTYYFWSNLYFESQFQSSELIAGGIFATLSALCIFFFLKLETYFFYSNRIEIETLFRSEKKVLYFNKIENWAEIEGKYNDLRWKELYITYPQKKVCFTSEEIHYTSIRKRLTRGNKRNHQIELHLKKGKAIRKSIGYALSGIFLIWFGVRMHLKKDDLLSYDELQKITGEIIDKPILEEHGRKSKSYSLTFQLKNHSKFNFKLDGTSYEAANIGACLANISPSDTITIFISKELYNVQFIKIKAPNFWARHFYVSRVTVYELEHQNRKYLELKKYNDLKSKSSLGILILVLIFPGFVLLILAFKQNLKTFSKT